MCLVCNDLWTWHLACIPHLRHPGAAPVCIAVTHNSNNIDRNYDYKSELTAEIRRLFEYSNKADIFNSNLTEFHLPNKNQEV